jgi:hypothetical protein
MKGDLLSTSASHGSAFVWDKTANGFNAIYAVILESWAAGVKP